MSIVRNRVFGPVIHANGTTTWDGVWGMPTGVFPPRASAQTGGPNDDDDEAALVRKLVPIVAIIILLAVVFGG